MLKVSLNLNLLSCEYLYRPCRSWRYDVKTGRHLLVCTSVHHGQSSSSSSPSAATTDGDDEVEAELIAGHYVVERRGADKSRLIHFSSIDFR